MTNPLKNKVIAFTGRLSRVRNRCKRELRDAGGIYSSTVSGRTDVLVAGPNAGSKLHDAQRLSIEIWDENDFDLALKGQAIPKNKGKKRIRSRSRSRSRTPRGTHLKTNNHRNNNNNNNNNKNRLRDRDRDRDRHKDSHRQQNAKPHTIITKHKRVLLRHTTQLPACKYGNKCFRKNKTHFEEYFHPNQTLHDLPSSPSQSPSNSKRNRNRNRNHNHNGNNADKNTEKMNTIRITITNNNDDNKERDRNALIIKNSKEKVVAAVYQQQQQLPPTQQKRNSNHNGGRVTDYNIDNDDDDSKQANANANQSGIDKKRNSCNIPFPGYTAEALAGSDDDETDVVRRQKLTTIWDEHMSNFRSRGSVDNDAIPLEFWIKFKSKTVALTGWLPMEDKLNLINLIVTCDGGVTHLITNDVDILIIGERPGRKLFQALANKQIELLPYTDVADLLTIPASPKYGAVYNTDDDNH